MYLNGFSSSMPMDIQLDALHEIPALRDAKIYRPGYAIEYDYFDPTQLKHSLESKIIKGLFFAGQVNQPPVTKKQEVRARLQESTLRFIVWATRRSR